MAYCIECGNDLPEEARFCSRCGARQDETAPSSEGAGGKAQTSSDVPTSPPGATLVRQPQSGPRVSRVRVALYVLVAAVVIGGSLVYGFQPVPIRSVEQESRDTVTELAADNASSREDAAARLARHQFCKRRATPLLRELNDLGSRLDVGLAFAEYGGQVGDISVAYDQLRPGSLGPDCLEVAVPLETAYRKYAEAYNIWNECIGDFGCSTDSIESQLQTKWLQAETAVARGERSLASMR